MWDLSFLLDQFFVPALFSFLLCVSGTLLAIKFFPKLGLMDRPEAYGLTRKSVPYFGGLVIFASFLISIVLFTSLSDATIGLVSGAFLIVLVGFLDDLFGLSPIVRLIAQFLAAGCLVYFGVGILSINIPFFGLLEFAGPQLFLPFSVAAVLFTIIWVMVIVNSMNFLDGISGLSSGVSFFACITIFLLSVHPLIHENPSSQIEVATISIIVAMVALAFLIFDFPKPKILMGDTGSTFFGFVIATLAIFSGGKVATVFLVLGVAILDMVWVVVRRIFEGKKFWQGDLKHLHHRLIDFGFSQRTIVLMYFALSAVFGFSAVWFVSSQQKFFMILALAALMVVSAVMLIFLPRRRS